MNKVEALSKILVAIDGSEMSLKAADYGIEFAKKYNSKLIVLHVYDALHSFCKWKLSHQN